MNIMLFSSGAENADTIVELPVGTFTINFAMKKYTRNTLGKIYRKNRNLSVE